MRLVVVLSFLLILAFPLSAQDANENERLKVGVVLSGGGAKGMAHIGVLKVIEEAEVTVDYIAGTSMGAIVASLYASGYSATELDSIFRNIDFSSLIQDNIPRNAKTFYEKEDSERYALTLPFDKFKVSTPQAFSGGQNVYNELVRLLYHVKDVKDFNDLPIPFLCIATNAESGEEVLLTKGYLPKAVSASAALPSLFEPTIVDDKILIDGGIVNNYPIDEVMAMGADVIIGSDVQHELSAGEELSSALEILEQINNYRTVEDMKDKSLKTDIYIKPSIANFSLIDFQAYDAIRNSGEVAARVKLDDLKEISQFQNVERKSISPVSLKDTLIINRLVIADSVKNYSRGYIKGKLRFELGKKITFQKLEQGINNLRATGNFKTIHYELVHNGLGEDLILKLKETQNRTFLRLAAHYDQLYKSAALLNMTRKNLLTRDDVSSLDIVLGDNVRYNFQYYIDKGSYWSFGINSRFNDFERELDFAFIDSNFELPVGISLNNINLAVSDLTNQIYLQTVLKEEFAFNIGIEHKFLKYSTRTFGSIVDETPPSNLERDNGRVLFEKSNFYSAFGQLKLDTYDDRYFPTRGLLFNGQMNFYAFSSDFNDNFKEFAVAKARMGAAFPILKNLSINLETEGGFKLGTSQVTSFDFALGGFGNDLINNFIPFMGYDFLELPGNSFVKAYGSLDFEFAKKNHLLFSANFANVEDDIFRTGEWFTEPDYSGYGIGYGWESFLGPVQVYYTWSPEEATTSHFFFSVGYWF
ncbi:patatin [Aggregatimonas sangjinii]|uniref:Patatin n=1 Tax=Aggregatimonas sangjinii TaxID=2583587 RepID=A0A5B7SZ89_9FLAO|nr:patatin-like phospholipase family protein [Aggregatimonas sangjinii]QCX02124.1 patatin [Aggregatimonas sangjinii]